MAATTATKNSIKEMTRNYLDLWYIGQKVDTFQTIEDKVAESIVKETRMMSDKQIIHALTHSNILEKHIEPFAKEMCIEKALGVSRPAKRENVNLEAKKKAQANAEAIVKELMSINPFEVIRYVSTDGAHEIKVTRGMGNPFIKVDGRPLRTHEYLLRVLKRNDWVKQD